MVPVDRQQKFNIPKSLVIIIGSSRMKRSRLESGKNTATTF